MLCTYRWYDPGTARWLTRDPIGYAGGSNLYGYVDGNPVGGVDPWGLMYKCYGNDGKTLADDDPFVQIVDKIMRKLRANKVAKKLLMDKVDSPSTYYIIYPGTPDMEMQSAWGGGFAPIHFTPGYQGKVWVEKRDGTKVLTTAPDEIWMAHELGHSVLGYEDDVDKTGEPGTNVRSCENPIRVTFGLGKRLKY